LAGHDDRAGERASQRARWNNPQATAQTFVDGWLRTGDVARIDAEGFCYVVDRAKNMLIRGGENIYCIEVETEDELRAWVAGRLAAFKGAGAGLVLARHPAAQSGRQDPQAELKSAFKTLTHL
jgi:AMP-binding enzyme